jgi:hypothetical protein
VQVKSPSPRSSVHRQTGDLTTRSPETAPERVEGFGDLLPPSAGYRRGDDLQGVLDPLPPPAEPMAHAVSEDYASVRMAGPNTQMPAKRWR